MKLWKSTTFLEHARTTYLCSHMGKPSVLSFVHGLREFLQVDPFSSGVGEKGSNDCCDMLAPKNVVLILWGRRRRVITHLNENQNGELAALKSENKHIWHVSRSRTASSPF